MTIPKTLKIGAHTYKVRLVKPPELADECPSGMTIRRTGFLDINTDNIRTEVEQTLFHEIGHVINSEWDHAFMESVMQQLYQVLHDNHLLK